MFDMRISKESSRSKICGWCNDTNMKGLAFELLTSKRKLRESENGQIQDKNVINV